MPIESAAEAPAWERTARSFLARWERRRDVEAAIACGSFVTGHASPRSDIDLILVLAEGTRWRERGNCMHGGMLIEYLANPPTQIRDYWQKDRETNRRVTATMFITGKVLFDKHGLGQKLVREAARWHRKPLPRVPRAEQEVAKYCIWDAVDSTLDALERRAEDFPFQYHHAVHQVYALYARHLRQPALGPFRVWSVLGPGGHPERYRLDPFPDAAFVRLLVRALREREPAKMGRALTRLAAHAQAAMGGFEIDGFRLRTPAVRED